MFPSSVLRLDVKRAVSARNIKSREDSLPPALIRRVLGEAGTRDDEHPGRRCTTSSPNASEILAFVDASPNPYRLQIAISPLGRS